MTRRRLSSAILLVLCIALPGLGRERESIKRLSSFDRIRLVRDAYRRMTTYNQANRILETGDPTQFDSARVLRFELSNFESGPIANIMETPWTKLVVLGGDVLSVWPRSIGEDGRESVTYAAEWNHVPYISSIQLSETMGDLLSRYAARNYDVGSYLSYTVTVTFDGRTRTYPALVLFHDLYGSADNAWPDFWDGVVGLGGALNKIAVERRPPTSPAASSRFNVTADTWDDEQQCIDSTAGSTNMTFDHPKGGYHSIRATFRNCCQRLPDNSRHRCVLWPWSVTRTEYGGGATASLGYSDCQGSGNINLPPHCYLTVHVMFRDEKSSGYTDSLSKDVTCYAAIAATWKKCVDPACAIDGALTVEAGLPQPAVGKAGFTFNVPNTGLGKWEHPETAVCLATTPKPCNDTEIADPADYQDGGFGGDGSVGTSPPCSGGYGGGDTGGSWGSGGGDPYDDIPIEVTVCASITIGSKTIQCCDSDALEIAACIIRGGDL